MISETYNFRDFCKKARFGNQIEAMDLVCDEIQRMKVENKRKTGSREFKNGTKEKAYYEDLQRLLSIVLNASLPLDLKPSFLQDILPFVVNLYKTNALMGEILKEIVRDKLIADTFKFED
jgi:stalled ribosome alternative rescue factor ArfA